MASVKYKYCCTGDQCHLPIYRESIKITEGRKSYWKPTGRSVPFGSKCAYELDLSFGAGEPIPFEMKSCPRCGSTMVIEHIRKDDKQD